MSNNELLLETRELTKKFGGLIAVNEVYYQVREGEKCGIVGPNGAGKTTLINLISGYIKPTKGQILYSAKDITKLEPSKRVELGIVRTFQLASLFLNMSVLENIALAITRFQGNYISMVKRFFSPLLDSNTQEQAFEFLNMVKLEKFAEYNVSSLPYGDRRKLEIAMALAQNPKMILVDEPFSGLSDPEINDIASILDKLCGEKTLVIVEHKISSLLKCVNRLSVMYEGAIIADGKPNEVIEDPKVQELYWRYKE